LQNFLQQLEIDHDNANAQDGAFEDLRGHHRAGDERARQGKMNGKLEARVRFTLGFRVTRRS